MTRRRFFDDVARSDDPLWFTDELLPRVERVGEALGDIRGCRVVEPGCGAGPFTVYLSRWVGDLGRVLAFDSSSAMVERCRRTVAGCRNVDVRQADVECLEPEGAPWDLVICFRVFPHFDDKCLVLRRCRSWLRPGGLVVIANLESSCRLNAFHSGVEGPVQCDRMPGLAATRRLVSEAGYRVETALEEEEFFFVEGFAE